MFFVLNVHNEKIFTVEIEDGRTVSWSPSFFKINIQLEDDTLCLNNIHVFLPWNWLCVCGISVKVTCTDVCLYDKTALGQIVVQQDKQKSNK